MVNLKNHSFKQFIYFSAPLRIFSKFFLKIPCWTSGTLLLNQGFTGLARVIGINSWLENLPLQLRKKTFSDKGAGCPDLLDIESNFTLYRESLT